MPDIGAGGFPLNSPEEMAARGTGQGGPSVSMTMGGPAAPAPALSPTDTPHDPYADMGAPPAPSDAPAGGPPVKPDATVAAPPANDDPYADIGGPANSTASQQVQAGVTTAVKAGLTTTGALTGMRVGAAGGAIVGAAFPPAEAIAVPLGAIGGLIVGWYATEKAAAAANLPDPQQLPEDQRPVGEFGAMVGGAAGIGGGLNVAAREATETGIPFMQRIIESAKGAPLTALRSQITPGVTAGLAGAEAEEHDPGNAWLRVPLEIAGGALSPGAILSAAVSRTVSVFNYARGAMGSDAMKDLASSTLASAIRAGGEDPNAIREVLATPDALGLDASLTASQKAASPALTRLEQSLSDPATEADVEAKTQTSLAALKNMLTLMFKTGDPASVSAAAEGRATYFRGVFGSAVNGVVQKAIDAAKSITGDVQAAIPELSLRVTNGINKVLDLVSGVEDEAWGRVDKTIPGDAPNIVKAADDLRGKLMAEDGETLPDLIESFSTRMKTAMEEDNEGAGVTTTGELMKFRSRMLALARQASAGATPNFLAADQYGKMATAALEDLGVIGDQVPGGEFKTAFDNARQITKEKMDVFYRTFVGKAITTGRAGEASVEPEAYLTRALGSGGLMGDVRMQQIQQATEFMGRLQDGSPLAITGSDADAAAASVADAQNRIVRLAAAKTIDPVTRRANLKALTKFIGDNGSLIDRFPGLRDDLENAASSEAAARNALDSENPLADDAAALEKVAGPDSGVDGVSSVMTGKNPQTGLQRLIDAVKSPEGGQAAQDGLRSAVIADALKRATGADGVVDFNKLDELLNQPMREGLPSAVSMLRDGGIMADDQAGRLTQILAMGQRLQQPAVTAGTTAAGSALPSIIEAIAKVGGSRLGSAVSRKLTGGTTIIAQAYFAKLSRFLLDKAVPDNLLAILQNAVKDPKVMADLLARPSSAKEADNLVGRIIGYGKSVAAGPLGYTAEAVAGQRQLNVLPELGRQGAPQSPQERQEAAPALAPPAEASAPRSEAAPSPAPAPAGASTSRSEAAPSPAPAPEAAVKPVKPTGGRALLPLIAKLENSDDDAKSPAGAVGRYQVELDTAKRYDPGATVEKLKTPAYNEEIAGKILDDLFAKYKGNVAQVLANYNASPRATKTFMKTGDLLSLPTETQNYLKRARDMGALE